MKNTLRALIICNIDFLDLENSKAQKLCQWIEVIWGHIVQIHSHSFQNLNGRIFLNMKIRFFFNATNVL